MNIFCQSIGIDVPIIQAPMAGGADTVELAAEVCRAGALGSLGLNYTSPADILTKCAALREMTDRPYCVNLFAPEKRVPRATRDEALERLRRYFDELGIEPPTELIEPYIFDDQFQAILESKAAVFSFTCGALSKPLVNAAKDAGMLVVGTATSVREARVLAQSSVDAIIAQGAEAGGHRAAFLNESESPIGTLALVPQIRGAVSIPVIAAGGIMDGRGIVASLSLGASVVQLGTAFLGCPESGIPDAYRRALRAADDESTVFTDVFSGMTARGIANRFTREMAAPDTPIAAFPVQNDLTRPLRARSAEFDSPDFLSLWAGQNLRRYRELPARALVRTFVDEMRAARMELNQCTT